MQFSNYETLYQYARRDLGSDLRKTTAEAFYKWLVPVAQQSRDPEAQVYEIRANQELDWYAARQPFYKVWPAVIPPLTKTSLDVTLTDLRLKDFTVGILLPAPQGSILVTTSPDPLLVVTIQIDGNAASIALTSPTKPIEQQVKEHPKGTAMLRLAVAILMLNDDPSIVEPMVLNKDRMKPHDAAHIEKARRRGLIGWDVGRHLEVIPHIRRPHFAIRWTGNGRTVPRLVPVKGCVIHKAAIVTIPTGHFEQ